MILIAICIILGAPLAIFAVAIHAINDNHEDALNCDDMYRDYTP